MNYLVVRERQRSGYGIVKPQYKVSAGLVALTLANFSFAQPLPDVNLVNQAIDYTVAREASAAHRKITYSVNEQGTLRVLQSNTLKKQNKNANQPTQADLFKNTEYKPEQGFLNKAGRSVPLTEIAQLRQENSKLQAQVRALTERLDKLQQHQAAQSSHVTEGQVASLTEKLLARPGFLPSETTTDSSQEPCQHSMQTAPDISAKHPPCKAVEQSASDFEQRPQQQFKAQLMNESSLGTSAKAYHHVVYIFNNAEDQGLMWNRLLKAGETDKWQGNNSAQSKFFIYVGAFTEQQAALERSALLSKILGVKPVTYFGKN